MSMKYTLLIMDPFMNGHLHWPNYCGLLSAVQIVDPYVNGHPTYLNLECIWVDFIGP